MPLLPSLIGNITVRERKQRYEGEPRYRRLDFVRSKKLDEEWDIIKSAKPIRAVQIYEAPAHDNAWPHDQTYAPNYRAIQAAPHDRWPQDHYIRRIPAPPLSGGQRPQLGQSHAQRMIEPNHGEHPAIIKLNSDSDCDSDDLAYVMEDRKPKPRSISRIRHSGHSIFSDSSDDDDDYERRRRKPSKTRGRSRSRFHYESDDERRVHSRRRAW